MPLKIFEKVSPFLKLRRPSSTVVVADSPRLPSTLFGEMNDGSAPRTAQLAPTESVESKLPSSSPMLKSMAWAGAPVPRAMAAPSRCGRNAARIVVLVMLTPNRNYELLTADAWDARGAAIIHDSQSESAGIARKPHATEGNARHGLCHGPAGEAPRIVTGSPRGAVTTRGPWEQANSGEPTDGRRGRLRCFPAPSARSPCPAPAR
ncbi:hypothetical protein D9M68_402930 [compost metagenome]